MYSSKNHIIFHRVIRGFHKIKSITNQSTAHLNQNSFPNPKNSTDTKTEYYHFPNLGKIGALSRGNPGPGAAGCAHALAVTSRAINWFCAGVPFPPTIYHVVFLFLTRGAWESYFRPCTSARSGSEMCHRFVRRLWPILNKVSENFRFFHWKMKVCFDVIFVPI